jgi:hypothetical protein
LCIPERADLYAGTPLFSACRPPVPNPAPRLRWYFQCPSFGIIDFTADDLRSLISIHAQIEEASFIYVVVAGVLEFNAEKSIEV